MTALPPAPVLPATATTDPAALLTLVQWLSPAFPTGAFAYSHGLEAVISQVDVTTAELIPRAGPDR